MIDLRRCLPCLTFASAFFVLAGCSTTAMVEAPVAAEIATTEVTSVSLLGMTSPETGEESQVRRALVAALAKDGFVTTSGFDLQATMQIGADYTAATEDAPGLIPGLASLNNNGRGAALQRVYTLSGTWQMTAAGGQVGAGRYSVSETAKSSSPNSRSAAEAGLPDPESKLAGLAERAADQIRRQAFPHTARNEVKLKGGNGSINDANKLVAAGQVEMAEGIYRDAAADVTLKDKHREAAFFNLAILEELAGDREAAMALYLQAQQQDLTDKRTLEAIGRLKSQGIE